MDVMNAQLLSCGVSQTQRSQRSSPRQEEAGGFRTRLRQLAEEKTALSRETEADAGVPEPSGETLPSQLQWQMALALMQTPQAAPQPTTEGDLASLSADAVTAPLSLTPRWELAPVLPEAEQTAGEAAPPLVTQETQEIPAAPPEAEVPRQTSVQSLQKEGTAARMSAPTLSAQPREEEGTAPAPEYAAAERPVFETVTHIPLQVGEVTAAETVPPEESVQVQLSNALTQAMEKGETKVRIQLQPGELGRVEVEMTWSREGTLHVDIRTETERTCSLLERSGEHLRTLLSRHEGQEVYVEVRRQEEGQEQPFYQNQERQDRPQHQSRQQSRQRQGEDFLQQLRLGLIPLEGEAS